MFFKKHVFRLVLDFWTQENSEKIAFEQVLGFFLTFSVYIKTYHRCSEKLLQNSGFLIERTYFFPSKVFSRAYRYFDVKKIEKKTPFQKSGWVLMDSPFNYLLWLLWYSDITISYYFFFSFLYLFFLWSYFLLFLSIAVKVYKQLKLTSILFYYVFIYCPNATYPFCYFQINIHSSFYVI